MYTNTTHIHSFTLAYSFTYTKCTKKILLLFIVAFIRHGCVIWLKMVKYYIYMQNENCSIFSIPSTPYIEVHICIHRSFDDDAHRVSHIQMHISYILFGIPLFVQTLWLLLFFFFITVLFSCVSLFFSYFIAMQHVQPWRGRKTTGTKLMYTIQQILLLLLLCRHIHTHSQKYERNGQIAAACWMIVIVRETKLKRIFCHVCTENIISRFH